MMEKIKKSKPTVFKKVDWFVIFISLAAIIVFHIDELLYLFGFKSAVNLRNQDLLVSNLPDLPLLFSFLLIPLITFRLAEEIFERRILTLLLSLTALIVEIFTSYFFDNLWGFGISYTVSTHSEEILYVFNIPLVSGLIYGVLFMGYIFVNWRKASLSKNRAKIATFGMLGILALGFTLRWQVLLVLQSVQLDPDVIGYRAIASGMSHLYDTSIREPLWPWIMKIWFFLFEPSNFYVRLLTVFLSVIGLYAVYRFFYDYTRNYLLALLTVFFLAIDKYLIYMSVRGLRLEIYIIAIIMFAYYVFVLEDHLKRNWRILNLGFWGMLTELIRVNSFVFLLPTLIFAFWKHKLSWRKLVIPIGIILVFLAPHLLNNYQQTGDWFSSANVHAVWFRNYEFVFVKGIGCEGCPTMEEMDATGWYAGDSTTTFHYIFGMHSLFEVVQNLVLGYLEIFVRFLSDFLHLPLEYWLMPLPFLMGLIGLGMLLISPFREIILFAALLVNLIAFVVSIRDFDPRLAAHVKPFIAFMLAFFVYGVFVVFPRIITKVKQTKSKPVYKTAWEELGTAFSFNQKDTEISK